METPCGTVARFAAHRKHLLFTYVEKLLDVREVANTDAHDGAPRLEYLVKWEGYSGAHFAQSSMSHSVPSL